MGVYIYIYIYIYIYKTLNLEAIGNEMSQFLNIEQYVNQK